MKGYHNKVYEIRHKSRFYYKVVWLGFLSTCLPILVGGLVFYYSSINNLLEQLEADSETKLLMMMKQTEREMRQIEKSSLEISIDMGVNRSFWNPAFQSDLSEQASIIKLLNLFKLSQESIVDILYYNRSSGTLLSNERGATLPGDLEISSDPEYAMAFVPEEGWAFLPQASSKGVISYFRKLPVMFTGRAEGLLIIHINAAGLFPKQSQYYRWGY
ncbi:hypothetical protein [Paenibacillus periandrae]|uniref:hypothetical protein n=1 Tax=Paenibacillus periandrae TaxID=1761741 RepID=UPI001F09EA51|nr:hypothetical protein [Paenibacillus periandrae]